jgi:hypothetical protein
MRSSAFVLVSLLAAGLVACQRQGARPSSAAPSASPAAAVATPTAGAAPGAVLSAEAPPAGAASNTGAPSPPAATPTATPVTRPAIAATTPVPHRQAVVLPAGTELTIRLQQAVSSDKSRPEDEVEAELARDVSADGRVVLPEGTEVITRVVVARRSGRVKGRARLVVDFEAVRLEGRRLAIDAARWDVTAGSSYKRDAAIAGGAAAAGAIIGGITGGKKGALAGAAIGGAAGGGAVLVTRGNEVELPAGSVHRTTLRRELRIE